MDGRLLGELDTMGEDIFDAKSLRRLGFGGGFLPL